MNKPSLKVDVSSTTLKEKNSYDVASIRIRAVDENGNLLPYYQEPIQIEVEGPVSIIGNKILTLKGGMGGLYIKTTGEKGSAKVRLINPQVETIEIPFNIV